MLHIHSEHACTGTHTHTDSHTTHTHTHTHTHTDLQTHRLTDTDRHTHTDLQIHRLIDTQTHRQTHTHSRCTCSRAQGTLADFKNELLFNEFGINYNGLPEQFKKVSGGGGGGGRGWQFKLLS